MTRLAEVGNKQAGRGQLDINQAGSGVVRRQSGWQAEVVRGNQEGRQASSWEPVVLDCESDVPRGIMPKRAV